MFNSQQTPFIAKADHSQRSICLLDTALQNQIAAGEVVERPASVLKELLENSLDAGANEIDIDIEDGGLSLIRISDNGHGIREAELELAVTRYATSKVQNFSELLQVSSYGFRGEALPSIASVSCLRLSSVFNENSQNQPNNTTSAHDAFFIEVKHGEISGQGATALKAGTSIEIRDLFANVPARLKFLKTPATEQKRCQDCFFKIALTRLDVNFSLRAGQRELFSCAKGENLLERLAHFWPAAAMENLAYFSQDCSQKYEFPIKISGLLGSPEVTQAKSDRQLFYVNGRPIANRTLAAALRQGYKGKLISKEHPQAIIFLEIDPQEVDVNVHPAKSEVRFRDEKAVFGALYHSVARALDDNFSITNTPFNAHENGNINHFSQQNSHNAGAEASVNQEPLTHRAQNFWGDLSLAPDKVPVMGQGFGNNHYKNHSNEVFEGTEIIEINEEAQNAALNSVDHDNPVHANPAPVNSAWESYQAAAPASALRRTSVAESYYSPEHSPAQINKEQYNDLTANLSVKGYQYLGQIEKNYLILRQGEHGLMLLVDQHAAHEIVLYQRFKAGALQGQSQLLALPIEINLHSSENERLLEEKEQLTALGFYFEFSPSGLCLLGLPPNLSRSQAIDFFRAVLASQAETNKLAVWDMWACRAAVKAGDVLTTDEALGLISQWLETEEREFCPHGRPVVLRFGAHELDKLFKRKP